MKTAYNWQAHHARRVTEMNAEIKAEEQAREDAELQKMIDAQTQEGIERASGLS